MQSSTTYQISMLLLPDFNVTAAFAFLDPFRAANYIRGENLYQWHFFGTESGSVIASNGAKISDTRPLKSVSSPQDLVVVNSSWAPERFHTEPLKNWLISHSQHGATLAGIDTGAFVLAYARLMEGYRAAVHYEHIAAFNELFPETHLVETLYVADRNRLTCGGGLAAADMALSLIQQHHGLELANAAAVYMLKERHRSGNEQQIEHTLEPVGYAMPAILREAVILMQRNIEEPISQIQVAELLAISQRQLERIFKKHTGVTPVRYYINLRLDRARGLVTQTEMAISQVASACGFGTAEQFSRSYTSHFGIPPRQDRVDGRIPFQFRSFPGHVSV